MQTRFVLVDVFAEEPFAGNQLCVCPEPPDALSAEAMLMLAREIGFSETTFVRSAAGDRYENRIFTPIEELPFAGHPTIGTAFVLASEGRIEPDATQTTSAGDVRVQVDLGASRATMWQLPPDFGPEWPDRSGIAAAAGLAETDLADGLPIQAVSVGIPHLMVPVRDEAALRRAERIDRVCHDVLVAADAESLYLFTVRADGDVMARMFDRDAEIGEDPATGSAVGPLGAYLAALGLAGMPGTVVVSQGELVGRPSVLHTTVRHTGPDDAWSIRVSGGVRIVGEGVFRL
jgi:trans-2,3-dihydro-3-hydroxyanthranilate isomerase